MDMMRFSFHKRRKSEEPGAYKAVKSSANRKIPSNRRSWIEFFKLSRRKKKATGEREKPDAVTIGSHRVAADDALQAVGTTSKAESNAKANNTATESISTPQTKEHLDEEDVQRLFSGAPHFSAISHDTLVIPIVSFPWDFELKTRDVSDAHPLGHVAFSGATLRHHLVRGAKNIQAVPRYDILVDELPNMLSAAGVERGTVGFEHFLQEPMADTLNHRMSDSTPAEEGFNAFSNFELLESQPGKLGIRKFDSAAVAERLVELTSLYKSAADAGQVFNVLELTSIGDLHTALFSKILTPPKRDNSTDDPTGVKVQIETLTRILNLKRVWYDFSNVEWRIRVGQLLFTEGALDTSDGNLSEPEDGLSERQVVLLQLLLACELYVRLESIAALSSEEATNDLKLTKEDVLQFNELERRKTKWDLVLARRFLENVDAKKYTKPKLVQQESKNLAQSLLRLPGSESTVRVDEVDVALLPRNQDQQLEGLFYFAKAIGWKDRSALEENLAQTLARNSGDFGAPSPSIYMTPLSTPGTMTPRSFRGNRESGYFGGVPGSSSPEMTPRSFHLQSPSHFSLNSSHTDADAQKALIGGWLTRSYLTGLIMPGEAISHLLISAILENDAEAITALGENANLYGGFVYKNRSYWSKSCIVGRVLACLKDSKECMGWISSSVLPDGHGDGWLDARADPLPFSKVDMSGFLEKHTALLGGEKVKDVRPADLTLPQDSPPTTCTIRFDSMRLETQTPVGPSSDEPSTVAFFDFTFPHEDAEPEIHAFTLRYLAQFISAYPCTPPQLDAMKTITSPDSDAKISIEPGHPLHKSYHYSIVSTTDLLSPKFSLAEESVTVLDARGDDTLEMLARAWCSNEGRNALVARIGTTCLSCAVREARGLDVKIVIRVGEV